MLSAQDRRELARWLVCGAVVLCAHAGIVAALIDWRTPVEDEEVGTDAIFVEYQPEQVQTDPTPQPVEKIEQQEEPPPVQQSEAMLPPPPETPPPEAPREETPVVVPRPQQARAQTATWRTQVASLIEHNKRFPSQARDRDEQGSVLVGFSVDRDGHLLSSRIVKSSGSAVLDAETLALLHRSQPFPPPPPELVGHEETDLLRFNIIR
jgi:protein TonB